MKQKKRLMVTGSVMFGLAALNFSLLYLTLSGNKRDNIFETIILGFIVLSANVVIASAMYSACNNREVEMPNSEEDLESREGFQGRGTPIRMSFASRYLRAREAQENNLLKRGQESLV